jgi:hypothetical protein
MGKIVNGRYRPEESEDVILDRMVNNATNYFGRDLTDDQLAAIRLFYEPVAKEFLSLQNDVGLVLNSAQIDYAEDEALDLLCSLINVVRKPAERATGEVEFSTTQSGTYQIPAGTVVQTDANTPRRFETTEQKEISGSTSPVTVSVEAVEAGIGGNVASNTVVVFRDKPAGVESVTNPSPIDGGTQTEGDEELRKRAKRLVADGAGASAPAIISSISRISEEIRSIKMEINDSSTDRNDDNGDLLLPDHSFEVIVECPDDTELYQEIAEKILEKKAAGDNCYYGSYGNAVTRDVSLPNGQTRTIGFSTPNKVNIYVDATIEKTDAYRGDEALANNIVEYIGGTLVDGTPEPGDLRVGDEVLIGEVEYAIRKVKGVYDVTSLEIGTASDSTSNGDILVGDSKALSNTDVAVIDANESAALTLTKNDV